MFVFTAKLTKKRLVFLIVLAGVFVCLLIAFVAYMKGGSRVAFSSDPFKNVKTAEERLTFIQSFGWRVKPDTVSVEEVLIPEEFDEIYTQYNEIQVSQGCDLTKYRGKRAKRYTYEIVNYPSGEEGVLINLLIYKDRVIGGDVMSPDLEGFIHGFQIR